MQGPEFDQLVTICFDISSSMNDKYWTPDEVRSYGLEPTRLDVAKRFIRSFLSTTSTGRNVYGLTTFDHRIKTRVSESESISDVIDALADIRPGGATKCFGAMKSASSSMIAFADKLINTVRRLIVISDGVDNRTDQATINALPDYLIANKIRVDAIILAQSTDEIDHRLVALANWTGGIAFYPESQDLLDKLATNQPFANAKARKFGDFHKLPIETMMFEKFKNTTFKELVCDPDSIETREADTGKFLELSNLTKISQSGITTDRNKRVMFELTQLSEQSHPDIRVFPLKDKVDVWKVLIKGPQDSQYNGWWYLQVDFRKDYPTTAPVIRFVGAAPFHPNITNEGRIRIDSLQTKYSPNMSLSYLLSDVIKCLRHPNHEQPVDNFHKDLYTCDRDLYNQKVFSSTVNNSRPTVDDWIKEWQ